ncbi:MAG TPA: dihydrolipoamide acetyltransferase family protein [Solirubrobacteraceae bacterium]|nr:dihydrolipoamide acetyltransferase family protein [Solirubrobacteraceae bacterium]
MADVSMPRLSDSMEEGTILKWLKSDGDEVKRGDELVEIETDKANMTYEADQDGVLTITASEGDTLAVGETIASIGEAAERPAAEEQHQEPAAEEYHEPEQEPAAAEQPEPEQPEQEQPEPEPEPEEEPEPQAEAEEPSGEDNGRPKASPVARRMARELGLELATVEGTGPGGRIVKADVEAASGIVREPEPEPEPAPAAAAEPPAAPRPAPRPDAQTGRGESEIHELTRLQQTVARRMAESKATAPDFVLYVDVDMEEAVELRKQLKAAAGDRPAPSFNDLIVKAAALALTEFPRANGSYRDAKFELYPRVNVGVAVAGQDALVVPTLFDADRKSLGEIARETRALAEKVRDGSITPPELSGGTFTVSNLGMYGIDRIVPVINPPQAAILGVGAMRPQPAVVDGEVTVRTRMTLTLTCDHRILYGADAAEFLARIRERLESPLSLVL